MERYTIRNEEASSIPLIADPYLHPAENGYAGLAAERLAKLEILYEQLTAQQETLEALRLAGKIRTTKFQQLMAKKLTDKNIIILLDTYVFDSSVEEK